MISAVVAFGLAFSHCVLPGISEPLRCGQVEVLEDRAKPDGRRIALNVVLLPALERRRDPPLFDLAGGPGMAATDAAFFFAGPGRTHRRFRDVVLVDQRGSGKSNPLHCPKLDEIPATQPMYPPEAVRECRETLAAAADLALYGTAQAVEDLDAVRAVLRVPKIDITALSYGTTVAIAYARKYPARVRAMALIGTAGDGRKLPLWHARNAQDTLNALVGDCLADAACSAAHPDLLIAERAAREALAGTPKAEMLRNLMGTNKGQALVPKALGAATSSDPQAWAEVFKDGAVVPRIASGLYLSVVCREDTAHIKDEEIEAATADTFLGEYRIRQQQAACAEWGLPPISRPAKIPAASAVPVLFLAGGRDHVTPPTWAREVAATFKRSRVVEIPAMAHFPEGLAGVECLDAMIERFFLRPEPGKVETGCIAEMRAPAFK